MALIFKIRRGAQRAAVTASQGTLPIFTAGAA